MGEISTVRTAIAGLRVDAWLLLLDVGLVAAAHLVGLVLRFDAMVPKPYWRNVTLLIAVAVPVYVGLFIARRLYGRVWAQAGVPEARDLIVAVGAATGLMLVFVLVYPGERPLPLSVPIIGGGLCLMGAGLVRFGPRVSGAPQPLRRDGDSTRVVLVGSTDSARSVIVQMRRDPTRRFLPAVVVTDEASAWRRRLIDVPVTGPVSQLASAAVRWSGEQVLLTYAHPTSRQVSEALAGAREARLPVKIVPTVEEIVDRRPTIRDIRDLSVADLMGRAPVSVDVGAVRDVVNCACVLITGAGGSIGSEIAMQVAALGPVRLVLLDHDETHLHDLVQALGGPGEPVLADIRDESALREVFDRYAPDVVFHAAAHKHVPILEKFPSEAVRTNVLGTEAVLREAVRHGTPHVVAISTDKAVNPSSVMGASKRVAETLVEHYRPMGARWCSVRFGNVLGSRGSVIPTFLRQIERGGPVTVTHQEATRFFMSIPEAVQLVLQAASMATGGEVFVLDMGEQVRIIELAERVIQYTGATPGVDVQIEITGLRPGEKLAEELICQDEEACPTAHPKIRALRAEGLDRGPLLAALDKLQALVEIHDEPAVALALFDLARARPSFVVKAAG